MRVSFQLAFLTSKCGVFSAHYQQLRKTYPFITRILAFFNLLTLFLIFVCPSALQIFSPLLFTLHITLIIVLFVLHELAILFFSDHLFSVMLHSYSSINRSSIIWCVLLRRNKLFFQYNTRGWRT